MVLWCGGGAGRPIQDLNSIREIDLEPIERVFDGNIPIVAEIDQGQDPTPIFNQSDYTDFSHYVLPLECDEACIPWNGRHQYRSYNRNKPSKWYFKVFV